MKFRENQIVLLESGIQVRLRDIIYEKKFAYARKTNNEEFLVVPFSQIVEIITDQPLLLDLSKCFHCGDIWESCDCLNNLSE